MRFYLTGLYTLESLVYNISTIILNAQEVMIIGSR